LTGLPELLLEQTHHPLATPWRETPRNRPCLPATSLRLILWPIPFRYRRCCRGC